jgi:anti-sigma factor RsiW
MEGRVSDLQLERYLLGELSQEERTALEARLSHDELLAARLEELRSSNQEILSHYPPAEMSARIIARAEQGTSRRPSTLSPRRPLVALVPLAAVIAALALLLPIRLGRDDDGTRLKGLDSRLVVHRQVSGGAEELSSGAAATRGDVLQVSYVAGGARYGVIVSLDGNGVVTVHYPERGQAAGELEPSGLVSLPYAYELDDAPGFERFFLVTSSQSFALGSVLEAVERLKASDPQRSDLELTESLAQTSFLLVKKDG